MKQTPRRHLSSETGTESRNLHIAEISVRRNNEITGGGSPSDSRNSRLDELYIPALVTRSTQTSPLNYWMVCMSPGKAKPA